ncbi:hypothetical protein RND71_031316 [Anisodus tanguticus]|uniref:Growth-regulating factor n=1 Tax=Anisodus tanguticus TaxID=243964 RepID=A0AAE1RCB6_9SOLA|nr:hypothetical protein RND71_031316 [Anisodus tanguticus]
MDFGVMDSGGGGVNICSDNTSNMFIETKQKSYGSSGYHKHDRSEDEWNNNNKDTKLARTTSPNLLMMRSNESHQMLSFATPNSQNVTMPYYYQHPSNGFARNSSGGCGSGALNVGNMHGLIAGVKGPFTPSQWMELEHQALIYKYITANVPIPPYLLNPIRKALESAGFSTFAGLRPNALGWGAFHLGFSNSNDPEPGRCRRTDGKKWRCSRDAVADQKYCERHMNRGRHRSRKPVERQTAGNSASGATTSAKLMNTMSSSASAAALASGGAAASNSLNLSHHNQLCNLQPAVTNPSTTSPCLERSYTVKENFGERYSDTKGPMIVSPSVKESQYSTMQKEHNIYGVTSSFGLVCADSLINPLNKSSSIVNCRDQESKSQHHPLRQFTDDWPKNQSDQSNVSWPDIDLQLDPTQLSISIPVVTSDLMSSTSSRANDKLTASPHGPTREHEAIQMGLGIGTRSWIPISWESCMGGPLGEVLHSTNNSSSSGDCKNKSSALNLMTEGWDRSPRMGSSPTGVLQKNSFGSLSNSSAGSSPRAENNKTTNDYFVHP